MTALKDKIRIVVVNTASQSLKVMIVKHTRQEAKVLGLPTCYGSACKKHPELEGWRRVSGACVECAKISVRERRKANPERTKEQYKKSADKLKLNLDWVQRKRDKDKTYRLVNKERFRASIAKWSKLNAEKVRLYAKRVKQNNKGKVNADTAQRRYAKLKRTPAWLTVDDRWLIEQAYELAALRTKMCGFQWHVDHIIPLQGRVVSGLHVPNNLQVIPWIDNVVKANNFELIT